MSTLAPDAYQHLARTRHSVRAFLPTPVPQPLLEELLHTARLAPSGANLQPGHFWLVQGRPRQALTDALCQAYRSGQPEQEDYAYFPRPMPMQLRKRQVAAAQALYSALGVARDDRAGRDRLKLGMARSLDGRGARQATQRPARALPCSTRHPGYDLGQRGAPVARR